MQRLQEIVRDTNVLVLSDEVYEHMVYDGAAHESVARYPDLAARSFIVSHHLGQNACDERTYDALILG